MKRAKKTGCVYLRGGGIWWIKYQSFDGVKYESSKGRDRDYAEQLLELRIIAAESETPLLRAVPGIAAMVGRAITRLRTTEDSAQGTIGAASELIVAVHLLSNGYDVFRSMSPHACCDLVAIQAGQLLKIEVKTVNHKDGRIERPTIRNRGQYDHLALVVRGKGVFFEPELPHTAAAITTKISNTFSDTVGSINA